MLSSVVQDILATKSRILHKHRGVDSVRRRVLHSVMALAFDTLDNTYCNLLEYALVDDVLECKLLAEIRRLTICTVPALDEFDWLDYSTRCSILEMWVAANVIERTWPEEELMFQLDD